MRSSFLALAVAAVLALSACSGDDDDSSGSADERPTTSTAAPVEAEVALTRGEAVVAGAGGDIALDEPTRQAAVDAAQQYVDAAMIAPLTDGAVPEEYAALFDTGVQASAIAADRAVLTDEGIPAPTETPTITATPVRIDGLAAADGTLTFLATTFSVTVDAETASGPVAVRRNVELTYAPSGSTWLVTAYRVTVERDIADAGTSTTTAAAG